MPPLREAPLRNLAKLQSPTEEYQEQKGDDGAGHRQQPVAHRGHAAKSTWSRGRRRRVGLGVVQTKFITQIRADYAFGHRAPSMSLSRLTARVTRRPRYLTQFASD